ncbi:MAG: PKD domain-containing protein [Thermoanaerobaculia bacterium]
MRKVHLVCLTLLATSGVPALGQETASVVAGAPAELQLAPPRTALPPQARRMTPEALAAWNALSPEKQKEILTGFHAYLSWVLAQAEARERSRAAAAPQRPLPLAPLARRVDGAAAETTAPKRPGSSASRRPCERERECGFNQPPEAYPSATPTSGAAPLGVQFYDNAYDWDGYIASWWWDFGDGGWASDPSPYHTYTSPGTYYASLWVSDDAGDSATGWVVITVSGGGGDTNHPPSVAVGASPAAGTAPLTVSFNASGSDPDPGDTIVSYGWSFGDGGTGAGGSVNHVYFNPGSYSVSVTATDSHGAQATAGMTVQVNAVAGPDADLDGLSDSLEENLAWAFAPAYFVSAGENAGTSMSRFADSLPQTPTTLASRVPPFIHYRVTPVGVSYGTGTPFQLVQIDYLSLWNRDDGLEISFFCDASLYALSWYGVGPGVDLGVHLLAHPHALDNERSAVLVAAPLASANNPGAYAAYDYYTAAHEFTFGFDHSAYATPYQPVPPGTHLPLALSYSKHSTYLGYNPEGQPILQDWVIYSTFSAIDFYFLFQDPPNYYLWAYLTAVASDVFYGCVVEHFSDQGGTLPGELLNVGERSRPINGSSFINDGDSGLQRKFDPLLWVPR